MRVPSSVTATTSHPAEATSDRYAAGCMRRESCVDSGLDSPSGPVHSMANSRLARSSAYSHLTMAHLIDDQGPGLVRSRQTPGRSDVRVSQTGQRARQHLAGAGTGVYVDYQCAE